MGGEEGRLGVLAVQWRPEDLSRAAVRVDGSGVCDDQADSEV